MSEKIKVQNLKDSLAIAKHVDEVIARFAYESKPEKLYKC